MGISDLIELTRLGWTNVALEMRFAYTFWLLLGGLYWYSRQHEKLNNLYYREPGERVKQMWNWPPAIWIAGVPPLILYHAARYVFPDYNFDVTAHSLRERVFGLVGFASLAYGLYCAALGRASINGQWSANICRYLNPRRPDRLVTGGAYAHARHPIYQGHILMSLGTALISNSWLVWPFPVIASFLTWIRMHNEDGHLGVRFGAAHVEYKLQTPKFGFIPIPWREPPEAQSSKPTLEQQAS